MEKLKKGAGDKIHLAVDTISEPDTQATTVRVLAENKPGKVIVILSPSEEAKNIRKDVDVIRMSFLSPLEIRPMLKLAVIAPTRHLRSNRLRSGHHFHQDQRRGKGAARRVPTEDRTRFSEGREIEAELDKVVGRRVRKS